MTTGEINGQKLTAKASSRPSLRALANEYPRMWQEVVATLREHVSSGGSDALINWRQGAVSELHKVSNNPYGDADLKTESIIKAQMTLLAIEQFADVMTGKSGIRPSLKDRAIFKFFIFAQLARRKAFSIYDFDRRWRRLKDPIWAAAELQRSGIWSIPTSDFSDALSELCRGRRVLEIGAGRGLLFKGLKDLGVDINAVDDESWGSMGVAGAGTVIQKMDAIQALKNFSPEVVICSWPPAGNLFEEEIFNTKSVQLYLVVLSRQQLVSGNWSAYKNQRKFNCTTSPAINSLLRPIETDQQLFIFRRISAFK